MVVFDEELVTNPVVSAAIITYNHKRYLSQCVESVLSQIASFDFEVVIADDCSTDGTREICLEYQKKYPQKVKLILQETNVGLINNYCALLQACRGDYIAQISGDDYWCDKNKLQRQKEALEEKEDCDLCYTNICTCDVDGNLDKEGLRKGHLGITFEQHLFKAGYLAANSWMFRQSVISYLDLQPWFVDESFALALDVLAHSKLYYLDEVMAVYRCHKGSSSFPDKIEGTFRFQKGVLDMQMYFANKYSCSDEIKNRLLIRGYLVILPIAIKANREDFIIEARKYLKDQSFDIDGIILDLREGKNALRSRAYKLGKRLLFPFSWVKKFYVHHVKTVSQ